MSWLLGELTVQCIPLQRNKSEQNQIFFLESLGDKFTIFNAAIIPWMVKLHSANIVCHRLFTVPLFLRKIVTPTSAPSVHMAARTGKPSIPTILRTFPIGVALLEISLQSKTDMFSP